MMDIVDSPVTAAVSLFFHLRVVISLKLSSASRAAGAIRALPLRVKTSSLSLTNRFAGSTAESIFIATFETVR